jgi:hypothetical protein
VQADEVDQRDQDEVREHPSRAQDHGRAQPHHVAESEDQADRIEADHDLGTLGGGLDQRDELEVDELLPDAERGDQEVVDARDDRGLDEQPRLRPAALPGDQDLGDGGRFGERILAVGLAHEVAPQRDQEENAEAPPRQTDEDRLERVRLERQRVKRREREDRARDHRGGDAPDGRHDDVLEQGRILGDEARHPDRQDRDRDRGFHDLPDLQPRIGRRDREDHAKQETQPNRYPSRLGQRRARRHDRLVRFPRLQRVVGVIRQ